MSNTTTRLIAIWIMVVLVLWGYWWLTWGVALVFLFIFPDYYEILAYGIIYDALYGLPIPQFWNFGYVFTATSIALFLLSLMIRASLSAYEPTI